MTDFFPLVFLPFKIIVLGIGAYFAIKWHFDREKEEKRKAKAITTPKA
ncbi:hypothetical protein [Cognatishimia activa]|uniref:Uncharacterized protein n=1 Tax=Cognatishimia activa TaxID=1715691 RepID=A0A0P1INJ2_9RHOB|nr:hypothetical protein [Cognatishimia activa]CUI26636.1 hypothetical protein TA5113_00022 [Cognatishimia activa]CUK25167.1 hypothetical protein TA5114_00957 [Cognatishimia activa]